MFRASRVSRFGYGSFARLNWNLVSGEDRGNWLKIFIILYGLTVFCPVSAQTSGITIYFDAAHTGDVVANTPAQLLPASYLVLRIAPDAFADAGVENPAVIRITLPPGAVLTQTVADGPILGRPSVHPNWSAVGLAVGEFQLDFYGNPKPVGGSQPLGTIGNQAVQLYRYVAGEHEIFLRINESTSTWSPLNAQDFLGVAIGIGPGVWPSSALSNWETAGIDQQDATFFFADLRQYDFTAHNNAFPVSFDAFWQNSGTPIPTPFQPATASLFTLQSVITSPEVSVTSQIGHDIMHHVVADLDRDGLEDCCNIDAGQNRLYWAFGRPDGSMQDLNWIDVVGVTPRTISVADVTGDGRPDILIGDANGHLAIFPWESIFATLPKFGDVPVAPIVTLPLAGPPSDSVTLDVNGDQNIDYLYSDEGANVVRVLLGPDFSQFQTYPVGAGPVAMAAGDFDGDGSPEVATVNDVGGSVSVLLNDAKGNFTVTDLPVAGGKSVGIDAADFNRDGRADLAIAFSGDKSIGVLTAGPGGQFKADAMQKIYFQKTPSAVKADNFDGLNGPDVMVGFADDSKLALCTSDAGGTLTYAYSIDTLADVEVDPFNNVVLPEDGIMSLAGGTTFGGVSSRAGVAGIQKQPIDVVHFPRSQNLSFAVTNTSSTDALLNLELYNDQGVLQGTSTQFLAAGSQFARYFPDLLGPQAGQPDHWVRGFLSHEGVHGIWLANNGSDLTYMDGGRVLSIKDAYPEMTFPVVDTGAGRFTSLELINPSKDPVKVYLTLYDQNGLTGGMENRLIGGRTHLEIDVASLFPSALGTDYVQISADRPILGVEMYGSATSLACLEGQRSGQASRPLYSPHVAVGNFGVDYYSQLNVMNSSAAGFNIQVSLYDDTGALQASKTAFLTAHGKMSVNLADFFSLTAPTSGYLVVDPQGPAGIVGSITFGDAAAGQFMSTLPLQSLPSNHFMMCHIANGQLGSLTFFTGLAVLNPNATPQNVRVTAYNESGLPIGSRTVTIPGHGRVVSLLDSLLPGLTKIFGGYVMVDNQTAAGGLLAFQLFGDAGLQFLSAVPAIPME